MKLRSILKLAMITLGMSIAAAPITVYSAPEATPANAPSSADKAPKSPGTEDDKDRKKETWQVAGSDCTVLFDDPFATDQEAESLFAMSRNGFKEEITGQIDKRATELDDSFAINFEPEGKPPKIISGKEAALEAMKKESQRFADHPPLRIVFSYPFAQSYGESAVVTYKCTVTGRGENPWRSCGYVTNIFIKRDNAWKQVHRNSKWKILSKKPGTGATPATTTGTTGSAVKTTSTSTPTATPAAPTK